MKYSQMSDMKNTELKPKPEEMPVIHQPGDGIPLIAAVVVVILGVWKLVECVLWIFKRF